MKKAASLVLCRVAAVFAANLVFAFDSPDMDWYEAKDLGLEGQIRGEEFERPYDRLPVSARGKAPEKFFKSMGRHSTGMSCRFVPYADKVLVKWTTKDVNWLDPMMTPRTRPSRNPSSFTALRSCTAATHRGRACSFRASPRVSPMWKSSISASPARRRWRWECAKSSRAVVK